MSKYLESFMQNIYNLILKLLYKDNYWKLNTFFAYKKNNF
jgi:hypothetical protein